VTAFPAEALSCLERKPMPKQAARGGVFRGRSGSRRTAKWPGSEAWERIPGNSARRRPAGEVLRGKLTR